jgi:predicted RNase H-like nuclease (RuvC/YqgF family)
MQDDIESLQAEIAAFKAEKEALEAEIKRLLFDEDIAAGRCHAQALHKNRQEKMRLETELLARRNKIRRLQGESPGEPPPNLDKGFPF